jgi:putative PEP-CTERM system TPR-repeat lipoprotein
MTSGNTQSLHWRLASRRAALVAALAAAAPIMAAPLGMSASAVPERVAQGASTAEPSFTVADLVGPGAVSPPEKPLMDVAMEHLRKGQFDQALELASQMINATPNDPVPYNVQGAAYAGKKDFVNARKSFEKALSVRPDDVQTLMNFAQVDIQQKDFASARKRYQAILEKHPNDMPVMMAMAVLENMDGKAAESLAWLQKAKAAAPDAVTPRLAIAMHYLRINDNGKAIGELTEALRSHPDSAELLGLLGRAQMADGKPNEAVITYKKLVSVQPNSERGYYRLGMAQLGAKNRREAEEAFKKAVQLKPNDAEAVDALAKVQLSAGRSADALKLAKDLQRASPRSAAGFALEGDLRVMQKRFKEATKAYLAAASMEQTTALTIKIHAAQTRAGDAKDADARLQKWLDEHPDDLLAWQYAASENAKSGKDKQAIEQYERVLQKLPNDANALNNLAVLYHRTKDPRALATAERAYKATPDSPIFADTLGWILVDSGKTERGLELLQKAAAGAPSNLQIRYHLAVALAKSGDKIRARKELESLLASNKTFPQREAAQGLLKQL